MQYNELPEDEKEKHRASCRAWYQRNKESEKERRAVYIKNNPDKHSRWQHNAKLKKKYGLTHSDYLQMLESQDHSCAICSKAIAHRRLHIDHCHQTGKVRGLLCFQCNIGLGQFRDNPVLLQNAIRYLN